MAINPKIKQKAEDIRSKIFGSEVRESLASGIEAISEDVEATKERQITVEETMQTVIDETTGKDVISAPEIIAAHVDSNGTAHPNLKSRLDNFEVSATQQLQQIPEQIDDAIAPKADKVDLDLESERISQNLASINSLSTTVGELGSTSTFKGSDTNTNIMSKTGMKIGDEWYDTSTNQSLRWNGTSWVPVGSAIRLGESSVKRSNLDDAYSLMPTLTTGIDLNAIVQEGSHFGLANGGYLNMSPDQFASRNFMLQVSPLDDSGLQFFQRTIELNDPTRRFVRRVHKTAPQTNTPWYPDLYVSDLSVSSAKLAPNAVINSKMAPKSVSNDKLFDNVLTKPNLSNGVDLNTVILEGRYFGLGAGNHPNVPDEFNGKSFMLDVKTYGTSGGFYIQHITEYNNPKNQMTRFMQGSTIITDWVKVGGGEGASGSKSHLAGKTIVCFGDSITEGNVNGTYPEIIGQLLGATVHNVGFGGCQMAKHMNTQAGNWYDEMGMYKLANTINTGDFTNLEQAAINLRDTYSDDNTAIVARLKAIDWNNVDYITIFYGTNDFASNIVPIGTDADIDGTTFKGAINYTINKLLSKYPHLKISFVTPYWRARLVNGDSLESDTNPNENGVYLKDYVDAIKERANANHIPVLDLYREGGINEYNGATYQTDGLHPTSAGYELVARKISAFLESKF